MTLQFAPDRAERTPAGGQPGSGDTGRIESWLEAALELAADFPQGQLSIGVPQQKRAVALLDDVRGELTPLGQDILVYFDTSRPRYEYTLSLALAQDGGRVLDVGCSPGHLSMALTKAGFEVQGIDLNSLWLVKYAPGWAERLRISHTNIEQDPMPFADASFDLVIFTEVLEHIAIKDPCAILGEIRRVLRPGGRVLLSTPNVANLSNVVALIQGHNVFWPPEIFYGSVDRHNREYTPSELLQLVERAGFAQYQFGYMNTWSNWNHSTAPLFHRMLDGSARGHRLACHPLFNNTMFVMATSEATAPARAAGDPVDRDDLTRVFDAQGEWNEHAGKSLATVVECLQSLRDDCRDTQSRLRQEVDQLSAVIEQIRSRTTTSRATTSGTKARRRRRR